MEVVVEVVVLSALAAKRFSVFYQFSRSVAMFVKECMSYAETRHLSVQEGG